MFRKIVYLTVIAITFVCFNAGARVRIDLTQANADPVPVALTDLSGLTDAEVELGAAIRDVVRGDLVNSGLFDVAPKEAYLQSAESLRMSGPLFNEWRLINVETLFAGSVQIIQEGGRRKARVEFRLFDVHGEKQLVGRRYTVDIRFWRHVSHRISDDIYQAMTGEAGHFTTRIVFIGEEDVPGKKHKVKKLCVMDQDTANYQCLTDGRHLVLTPRFNPRAQKIIYMSYARGVPRLYMLDLPTGKQELVGDFEGLNSSPRFSPDGKSIIMTLTKGHAGNPEIYTKNLETGELKRLTFHRGIDTSPSFALDGEHIVFNSNRGGRPALYIMDKNGDGIRRLTFSEGRYYAPVWSPRGDLIAFVKELNGRFHIGVIDPQGEEERLLTDSYLDESPTWSPNGRVILFARQLGDRTRLYSIDLTGHNERQLKTPTDASDPAWSPLLR